MRISIDHILSCYLTSNRGINTLFVFFNDTATTEIYTLSLHDALPISQHDPVQGPLRQIPLRERPRCPGQAGRLRVRSEEHTSELQSRPHLVCRLLLEKKKKSDASMDHYQRVKL